MTLQSFNRMIWLSTDLMIQWSDDLRCNDLVIWWLYDLMIFCSADPLIYWPNVLWIFDPLIWSTDLLIQWSDDLPIQWSDDLMILIHWSNDLIIGGSNVANDLIIYWSMIGWFDDLLIHRSTDRLTHLLLSGLKRTASAFKLWRSTFQPFNLSARKLQAF